jgi:hypothetical protein
MLRGRHIIRVRLAAALPEWHGPGSQYPIPCYAGMGRKP